MTTTYELYTNENGTPKAVEGKAPAIIERVEALETEVTQGLAGKANTKHTHTVSQITDMPKIVLSVNDVTPDVSGNVNLGLHAVATSGDYNDLRNKPSITSVPGTVIAMAANSAPSGYLLCNGAAVSRTTYANLFAAIGTTYGAGDGSTTFNLPNLTDKFIQGSGTAGTVKSAGLPNILGSLGLSHLAANGGTGALRYDTGGAANYGYDASSNGINVRFDASLSNEIYGNSSTVQPPALTMRYYIKY